MRSICLSHRLSYADALYVDTALVHILPSDHMQHQPLVGVHEILSVSGAGARWADM